METQARIDRLSDEEFQRKYGVNRKTFEAMEEVLQEKYSKDHTKGGRKPKLSKTIKKHKLTPNQKKHNSVIRQKRVVIEHVNRYLKRFRLLSSRYKNKQKRFALRFSLIAGIYNFQHRSLVSE